MLPDQLTRFISPSLAEAFRATVKDVAELLPMNPSRIDEGGAHVLTFRFRNGGVFVLRSSIDGRPLGYEAQRVKFERLGDEIFVSAA